MLRPPSPAHRWARRAAAVALAGTAVLVVATAAVSLLAPGSDVFGLVLPTLGALGLAGLALGIARRSQLAQELLPSVGVVGLVVAVVVALGSATCGTWLTPTGAECEAFQAVRLVPPLVAAAGFGVTLWAVTRLGRAPA
jgi:multisubunit Na+/H+ antiporter MnhB subunit